MSGERFTMEIITLRSGSRLLLKPEDRIVHLSTKDDLNLGGELHRFAIFRADEPKEGTG